jgi:ribosomal protein S18 acetylase RimI-like enzyme
MAWSGRPTSDAPLLETILRACRQQRILAAVSGAEHPAHVACGLAVLDHDLVGLFDLVTDGRYRRRGYGAALVAGLLGWGLAHGAQRAYLQVARTNTAACALYRKLGFSEAYSYWYRVRRS